MNKELNSGGQINCPNKCYNSEMVIWGHQLDPRRKYKCNSCGRIVNDY